MAFTHLVAIIATPHASLVCISVPLRTPWPSQDCAYTKQYLMNDLTDDKGEGGLQGGTEVAGPELQGVAACRRMTAPLLGLNLTTHVQSET